MSQQAEQGATTAAKRPGKRDGQASEFTIIFPLKPGGAEIVCEAVKLRESAASRQARDVVGTIHDLRVVLFDNDTQRALLIMPGILPGNYFRTPFQKDSKSSLAQVAVPDRS